MLSNFSFFAAAEAKYSGTSVPDKPPQPGLIFVGKASYVRAEHMKGASLRKTQSLLENIRLA
jgi:hypothetical protein